MVQFFNLPQQPQARLAEQMGIGLGQGVNQIVQQKYQQGVLRNAFNKLSPEGNFLDQLKAIAPELLTTPGGAQALGELSPLLGQYAQNNAIKQFVETQRGKTGAPPSQMAGSPSQEQQPAPTKPQAPSGEDYYRNPEAYASPESTYPERTVGPQEQPELSAEQIRQGALDLMDASAKTGKPISYNDALQTVSNQNNQTVQQNNRIREQKDAQQASQRELSKSMVARASNSGYVKTPEDQTVAEKLSLEALRFPNEAAKWEHVRNGMRQWETAKAGVQRAGDLSGPFATLWRQGRGTYKDKKILMDDVREPLKFYKEHGLFNEARQDLSENLGFGPDDVERTIFPPSKEESNSLMKFPKSPHQIPKSPEGGIPFIYEEKNLPFPGEEFKLPDQQFHRFKDNLQDFIKNNPNSNLVVLRTELNQGKRYAWQDIRRALNELIDEGQFVPDRVQEQQMNIIKQAPLPGLMQIFQHSWTGAK